MHFARLPRAYWRRRIKMCKVENEYGSFGEDSNLIRAYYETMRESGFDIPIFF